MANTEAAPRSFSPILRLPVKNIVAFRRIFAVAFYLVLNLIISDQNNRNSGETTTDTCACPTLLLLQWRRKRACTAKRNSRCVCKAEKIKREVLKREKTKSPCKREKSIWQRDLFFLFILNRPSLFSVAVEWAMVSSSFSLFCSSGLTHAFLVFRVATV